MENKTKMINVLHFDDGSTASAPVRGFISGASPQQDGQQLG